MPLIRFRCIAPTALRRVAQNLRTKLAYETCGPAVQVPTLPDCIAAIANKALYFSLKYLMISQLSIWTMVTPGGTAGGHKEESVMFRRLWLTAIGATCLIS